PTTSAGNEENPVVFYDFTTSTYWHFIGTNEPNIGHLDSLLSTPDALYMADMADGSLFSAPTNTGAIYKVIALPPGDFNGDGRVDAADYVVWRKANGPAANYDLWRTNFGVGISG